MSKATAVYNSNRLFRIDGPNYVGLNGTQFSTLAYDWQVTQQLESNANSLHGDVTLTSRYTFDDKAEIEIEVKKGADETVVKKKFVLEKETGKKQRFQIDLDEYQMSCTDHDSLSVFATISVSPTDYVTKDWGSPNNFIYPDTPHDAVLIVDGTKFYVWKLYLATWSRYFDTLFYGEFKKNDEKEITLRDVDVHYFVSLLNIIYPSLRNKIDGSNVLGLLELADRFYMPSVIAMCGTFLCDDNNLPHLHIIDRLELAEKHEIVHLQIFCFEKIHAMSAEEREKFQNENGGRLRVLSRNTLKNLK